MKTKVLVLAVAAAAVGAATALAAPPANNNKNTATFHFTSCTGAPYDFYASKSTGSGSALDSSSGSGTSFELADGSAFLVKSITQTSPPGDTFTNKGWDGHADKSDETITCNVTSPATGIGYSVTGVFVPHKE